MGMILCFPGCAILFPPVPEIHFELEDATIGNSLDILSMEGGKVVRREGNKITTIIDPLSTVVEFEVSSGSRKSVFTCELYSTTGLYAGFFGAVWGVSSILSQDGSLWVPRKVYDTFKISGEHTSDAFLLGSSESRTWGPDGDLVVRKEEPNTPCLLNSDTLALKCQGRSKTSLAVIDTGRSSTDLQLSARPGSHFLLESEGAVNRVELLDDSSKRVSLGTGITTIKWFIPGLDEPQVEVVVDGNKTSTFLDLSFSSGNGRRDRTGS